jgi:hypothetical protein
MQGRPRGATPPRAIEKRKTPLLTASRLLRRAPAPQPKRTRQPGSAKQGTTHGRRLDPEDLVYTLHVADYNGGVGKVEGKSEMAIRPHKKIASFVGTLLKNQYLIVELVAEHNTPKPADNHNLIVLGPIGVP